MTERRVADRSKLDPMRADATFDVDPVEFAEAKAVASEILGAEVRSDDTVMWFVRTIRTDPERVARLLEERRA